MAPPMILRVPNASSAGDRRNVTRFTSPSFGLGRMPVLGEHVAALREWSMRLLTCLCFLPLLTACPGTKENVPCTQDTDCDLTTGGKCVAADTGRQWCAYPDPACSSGFRFSDQGVGDDLGGTCTAGGSNVAKYTLTVTKGGSGEGGITGTPTGLTCSGNTCTGQFDEGTVVQLTATATMGQFLGWSNACTGKNACSVTMDHDQSVGALFGTPGATLWAKQFGTSGRDVGHGIAVDSGDNILAVGEFTGTLTIGTTTLTSAGGADIYVAKLSSTDGSVVWAKRFGGTSNDVGWDVATDASNNVYVTGRFLGSVDFGGGAIQSGSQEDVFVLKLAADGSYGWARKIGGSGYDVGQGIAARGNAVVVVGFFNGSMTVDTTTLTSAGSADIFAMSMATADGATNWVKRFGGSFGDVATDVAIDNSGNAVLTGWYAGTVNFGGGAMSTPGDLNDVLLLKLAAADGAHLFSTHYGGSAADAGYAVSIDGANNIYLAGEFQSTASFGCAGSFNASQANQTDVFVAKYSQAGSCAWAKGFGSTGTFDRTIRGIATNTAGDVAISGNFCGSMSFGGSMLTSAGACSALDVFAARFATDGTHLNSVRMGGTGSEFGFGVAQSADGRFYTTGQFSGLAEFGGDAFTSAGDVDAFIVALEAL